MKTIWFAAGLFLIAGFSPGQQNFIVGTITGDNVNLRVGPTLESEIVGQVEEGEPVNVFARDGEWCAISPPVGLVAWVSALYVKDGVVTGRRVNVRSGPSTAYARLYQVNEGDRLEVIEQKEDWLKIVLPDEARLWVSARYVSLPPQEEIFLSESDAAGDIIVGIEEIEEAGIVARSPKPTILPPATPFLPRSAPADTPGSVRKIETLTGYVRSLPEPLSVGEKTISYDLVQIEPRSLALGYLWSRSIALERYRNRKVRMWGEEMEKGTAPLPVWEVKGIQILW